jgi:hypothetical protein
MGGSSSSAKNANARLGALRIHLDNSEVASGDTVRGTIGLVVNEQINLDTINIEFSGDMEVHFTEDNLKVGKQRIPQSHSDRKVIVCFSRPLYTWPDRVILPGQYTLPFALTVPAGIPSSLHWTHARRMHDRLLPDAETSARVTYKLSVWLMPGIQDSVIVGIRQREGLPSYETSFERNSSITSWCSNKGSISYALQINRGAYFIGDEVVIRMSLNLSQSQIRPTQFRAELNYRMHLQTNFHSDITGGTMDTNTAAVDARTDVQELELRLRLQPDRCGTLSTLQSDMIKCEFYVVVVPMNESCCVCYENLSSEMKIVVNSKLPYQAPPLPPPDWSPVQLEGCNVEFNARDSRTAPSAPPPDS